MEIKRPEETRIRFIKINQRRGDTDYVNNFIL